MFARLIASMSNTNDSTGVNGFPSRILPSFMTNNGTRPGNNYYVDPSSPKFPSWIRKQSSRRRCLLTWCLCPTLLILIFISWYFLQIIIPLQPVGEFDKCPDALAAANVPTADQLARFTQISTSKALNPLSKDENKWARVISADALMDLVDRGQSPGPRILHQSWKDGPLPAHFERWSREWRQQLDETWVYVLWRDGDNRKLVERHYPKYLKAYNALPREIYRADMIRNMYMHHFGGVYADLDLVAVGPLHQHLPILKRDPPSPVPIVYLGHMGDDSYPHSIPNAFMVSASPGHAFWLKPLDFIKEHQMDEKYNSQPEGLTGPVALRACVKEWEKGRDERAVKGEMAEILVLPNDKIYPFSWHDSPQAHMCLCRLHSPYFSEKRCQWLYPTAWTITYWTHSWGF